MSFSKSGLALKFAGHESDLDTVIDGEFKPHEFRCNAERLKDCLSNLDAEAVKVSRTEGKKLFFHLGDLAICLCGFFDNPNINPPTKTTKG